VGDKKEAAFFSDSLGYFFIAAIINLIRVLTFLEGINGSFDIVANLQEHVETGYLHGFGH
jgi:hypothetical protein